MSKEVWILIRYVKKFLNSDWLWAVHFFSKYSEKKNNPNFLIFLFFYFSNFLIFLLSKCDLRTRLHNFFMYGILLWFLVQFEKTYTHEFFKHSSFGLIQFW
jgi:hypothetical protein